MYLYTVVITVFLKLMSAIGSLLIFLLKDFLNTASNLRNSTIGHMINFLYENILLFNLLLPKRLNLKHLDTYNLFF